MATIHHALLIRDYYFTMMEQQYGQGMDNEEAKRTRRGGKKRRGGVAHRVNSLTETDRCSHLTIFLSINSAANKPIWQPKHGKQSKREDMWTMKLNGYTRPMRKDSLLRGAISNNSLIVLQEVILRTTEHLEVFEVSKPALRARMGLLTRRRSP